MELSDIQKAFLLNLLTTVSFTVDQADLATEIKQLKDYLLQEQVTAQQAAQAALQATQENQPVSDLVVETPVSA